MNIAVVHEESAEVWVVLTTMKVSEFLWVFSNLIPLILRSLGIILICRSTVILWFNTVSNGFILEQVHRLLVPFSKNTVLHSSDILITVTWISFSEWEIAFSIIIRVQRGSCPWGGIQYSLISKPVHLHICHSSSSRLFRHSQGENWAVTHPLLRAQEQVCQTS